MEITNELKMVLSQYKEQFKKDAPLEDLPKDMTTIDIMSIAYRSMNDDFDMFEMYKERKLG